MVVAPLHPPQAPPTDPMGQKFLHIFGTYRWQSLEALNTANKTWRILPYQMRPRVLWQNWKDPTKLVGVRFSHQTTYGLIDIDKRSPYLNPKAIADIRSALETIGITRTLLVRSSFSNGIHLYFPLEASVPTFDLAVAVEQCLKAQEFTLAGGILEIFPNAKTYGIHIKVEYNGHRLPLQPCSGSCLLDDNLNPMGDSLEHFLREWATAAAGQDWNLLQEALPRAREARKQEQCQRSLSPITAEWRADLESDLSQGWTGRGQTNHLLRTIACYGIVFEKLEDVEALTTHIVNTAIQLPGYRQYCGHQHEIHKRAGEWARCALKLYWPAGSRRKTKRLDQKSINQQRAEDAQQRIQTAVKQLREMLSHSLSSLPIRELAEQIRQLARCSLTTLYKYAHLWKGVAPLTEVEAQETPVTVPHKPIPSDQKTAADPPDPDEIKVLHTQGGVMKCEGPNEAPLEAMKSLSRGVRGDLPRFPQVAEADIPAPIPFEEVHAAIQQKVSGLNWSLEQVRQFMAEHFQGRDRIWKLSERELTTYLYYLETEAPNREYSEMHTGRAAAAWP